jgi:[CysO sulfur-carrier protein]-S-L-cysteine hydrolase
VALRIGLHVLAGIIRHARDEAPRECCGLLVGQDSLIDEFVGTRNLRASEVAYEIDPADHFAVIKRTRRMGRTILGAYHSHPRSAAIPSPTDLAEAHAEFLYVIVSLRDQPPDVRAYWLVDGSFAAIPFEAVP